MNRRHFLSLLALAPAAKAKPKKSFEQKLLTGTHARIQESFKVNLVHADGPQWSWHNVQVTGFALPVDVDWSKYRR